MKKILYLVISILLFTGCTELSNTPTKRVEEFFKKYQTLDNDVLNDLNQVITQDVTLNATQQEDYRTVMKKHYQNLTYEIKEETIDGDRSTVTAEITVTDLNRVMDESENYMNNNIQEFFDEFGNYSISMYNDYRLEQLKMAKEKVKYTVYLNLSLQNDEWVMDDIDQVTYDKINGTYNY